MTNKIKNRKINCHIRTCSGYPEKWIHGTSPRMTHYQRGRSMVEMLGVLAIIGVLSVGGVAMYTSAMNKYRANEILNEASKRAVMVAGQLLTNPNATTMSLAQFGSNAVAGGTFGGNATIANGKITLTVSGVETAVCNQMKAATGTNSVMTITGDCGSDLILSFNNDMSHGTTSETEAEYVQCRSADCCPEGTTFANGYGYCKSNTTGVSYGSFCMYDPNCTPSEEGLKSCNDEGLILSLAAGQWTCASACIGGNAENYGLPYSQQTIHRDGTGWVVKNGYCQCAPGWNFDGYGSCNKCAEGLTWDQSTRQCK